MKLSDNEGKTPLDYAKELENGEDMLAILEGKVIGCYVLCIAFTLCVQVMHPLSGRN